MAFIPIPAAARLTAEFLAHNQLRQINLGFVKTNGSAFTLVDLHNLVDAVQPLIHQLLLPYMGTNIALTKLRARDLSTQFGQEYEATVSPPDPGTQIGALPGNVTIALSERTDKIGRRNRGRHYMPGIVGGDVNSDDTCTAPFVVAMVNWLANLIFGNLPAGIRFAVISLVDAKAKEVVTGVVDNVLDSQRRRLPGRGR